MSADSFVKQSLAPLILRLALAAIFIYHGLEKIVGKDNNWGAAWATNASELQNKLPPEVKTKLDEIAKTEEWSQEKEKSQTLQALRVQLTIMYSKDAVASAVTGFTVQIAVAWGELAGGIALLLGVLTRWAALGLLIIQIGAIATVTWAKGFSFAAGGGYEYNLVIVASCLAVVCLGSGDLSLSRCFAARPKPPLASKEPEKTVAPAV